jgi:hypothetical protein
MAPSATSAADKGFIGDGAVVSYLSSKGDNHETYGNGTSLGVRALQHLPPLPTQFVTGRTSGPIRCIAMLRRQSSYGNPNGNFSGYGNRDVWGHWGAYYGPMIPTGAGGR